MSYPENKIAAFDFDGTLTTRDSMFAYIAFVKGKTRLLLGMIWLLPMLIRFKLGIKDRQEAKEQLLYHFFGGMDEKVLRQQAEYFSQQKIPQMLRKEIIDRLTWHQNQGHRCFLVSASLDLWLQPFADTYKLELLSTQAQFSNGKYTRTFRSANCYGPEKVKRIQAALEGQPDYFVYAYGDSNGDREMLAWADEDVLIS
jgi:HAD superfamily hydrolase (TIGR01490 family)